MFGIDIIDAGLLPSMFVALLAGILSFLIFRVPKQIVKTKDNGSLMTTHFFPGIEQLLWKWIKH